MSTPALLFGESQGRIVVSTESTVADRVLEAAARHDVPCRRLGIVEPPEAGLSIRTAAGTIVRLGIDEAIAAYYDSIAGRMERFTRDDEAA